MVIDDTRNIVINVAAPLDPCDGVVCPDQCIGYDMYDYTCDNGDCVQGDMIYHNSPECGYEESEPKPDGSNTMIYIIIGTLIIGYLIIRSG